MQCLGQPDKLIKSEHEAQLDIWHKAGVFKAGFSPPCEDSFSRSESNGDVMI